MKRVNKNLEIVDIDDEKLISFKTHDVKINIYDKKIAEKFIDDKFNDKYKELMLLVLSIEDDSDDNIDSIRDRIEELKEYITLRYGKVLSKAKLNKYLKMLILLEEKIPNKRKNKSR